MQNMNQIMKQMQNMQKEMMKSQEELEGKIFEVTTGGGMIQLEMNGKYEVKSIKINPEAVDPDDVEMLEDLILSALQEANKQVSEALDEIMGKLTGGMKIPGIF